MIKLPNKVNAFRLKSQVEETSYTRDKGRSDWHLRPTRRKMSFVAVCLKPRRPPVRYLKAEGCDSAFGAAIAAPSSGDI